MKNASMVSEDFLIATGLRLHRYSEDSLSISSGPPPTSTLEISLISKSGGSNPHTKQVHVYHGHMRWGSTTPLARGS